MDQDIYKVTHQEFKTVKNIPLTRFCQLGHFCSNLLPRQGDITFQIKVNRRFYRPDVSPCMQTTFL